MCELCNKSFRDKSKLRIQIKSYHEGIKFKATCKGTLDRHIEKFIQVRESSIPVINVIMRHLPRAICITTHIEAVHKGVKAGQGW